MEIVLYEFKLWMEHFNGGISVDTKNGKNVFCGYEQ